MFEAKKKFKLYGKHVLQYYIIFIGVDSIMQKLLHHIVFLKVNAKTSQVYSTSEYFLNMIK